MCDEDEKVSFPLQGGSNNSCNIETFLWFEASKNIENSVQTRKIAFQR